QIFRTFNRGSGTRQGCYRRGSVPLGALAAQRVLSSLRSMVLRNFEKRLERMVEGAFSRVFRSGLRPVEIGRRLVREMNDSRSIGVRGNTVVANDFTVHLSQEDMDEFADVSDSMRRKLADLAREEARENDYDFMGPVEVELVVDPSMRVGS